MNRLLATALVLFCSCPGTDPTPNPDDETNRDVYCSEPEKSGAPKNLLDNPSFECGAPPTGWTALGGAVESFATSAFEGAHVARLTADASGTASLWHAEDVLTDATAGTYCATAWMRGAARDGRITVRVTDGKGGAMDHNFSSPLATQDWTLVPPPTFGPLKFEVKDGEQALLRVWIPNAAEGEQLEVDLVRFWRSTAGDCREDF